MPTLQSFAGNTATLMLLKVDAVHRLRSWSGADIADYAATCWSNRWAMMMSRSFSKDGNIREAFMCGFRGRQRMAKGHEIVLWSFSAIRKTTKSKHCSQVASTSLHRKKRVGETSGYEGNCAWSFCLQWLRRGCCTEQINVYTAGKSAWCIDLGGLMPTRWIPSWKRGEWKTAMLIDTYASAREEGNKQFTMQRRAFELRICFSFHVALGWISLTRLNLINGNTGRNHESTVLPLRRRLWKFEFVWWGRSSLSKIGHFAMNSCFRLLRVCCYICLFFWVWHSTVVVDYWIGTAMRAQCHPQRPYMRSIRRHTTQQYTYGCSRTEFLQCPNGGLQILGAG